MTNRQKLKELGLDYKKIAGFFGYSPSVFSNSTRRKKIEAGVLKVVEHIMKTDETKDPWLNSEKYE